MGTHVTFGVSELKTHGKTALVVYESGGLRSYVHIGTGNLSREDSQAVCRCRDC